MALITHGILGPFSGHVGNIIGYIRNGQFCMRSMPTHYHDRRSQRQLDNRSRFTLVMKIMSLVRPVITLGFHRYATDMTEMNAATRENYYSLVKPTSHGLHYNFPGLILSRGHVEPLSTPIHTLSGNTLQFLWNGQTIPGAGQDNVSILLLNTQRMAMKFFHNIAHRQDGSATITIPTAWNHEEIYSYILVERHGNWSNSFCTGTLPWNEETSPSTPKTTPSPIPCNTPSPTPLSSPLSTLSSNLTSLSSKLTTLSSKPNLSHQSAVKLLLPSPLIRDHG